RPRWPAAAPIVSRARAPYPAARPRSRSPAAARSPRERFDRARTRARASSAEWRAARPARARPGAADRRDSSRARRRRSSRRLGGRRSARGGLLAPPPAALARAGVGKQHRLARFRVRRLERAPPDLDLGGHLAARGAQGEEVVRHAKARRLEQAVGTLPPALVEARLHHPHLAHRRGQLARDRELLALDIEHLVHRVLQGGDRALAAPLARLPRRKHLVPEERGEEKRGRYRALGAHALV